MNLRHTALVVPACLALAVAACGKHAAPAPVPVAAKPAPKPAPPRPAPAPKPAAPVTPAFHVTGVTLGTMIDDAYAVALPTTRIPGTIPTIYASVATAGSTPGATLSARWYYLAGKDPLVTETSQPVRTDGAATTAFKLYNPNRWPLGAYRVDIALDGRVVAHQAFEVVEKK